MALTRTATARTRTCVDENGDGMGTFLTMSCIAMSSCVAPTSTAAAAYSVRDDDSGHAASLVDEPVVTAAAVAVDGAGQDVGAGAGYETRTT